MKRMLCICALMVMFSISTFALDPVKPHVNGKTIQIGNSKYSMEKCYFLDGLDGVATADWAYALPQPEGRGDWCDIIVLRNGNYGIVYGGLFYEFNSKQCDVVPKQLEVEQIVKYLEDDYYSGFPDNAKKDGKKMGYTYADSNDGELMIILYGYY